MSSFKGRQLKVKGAATYAMRCDFRRLANVSSHKVKSRTESGRLFQTCAAAAANEQSTLNSAR